MGYIPEGDRVNDYDAQRVTGRSLSTLYNWKNAGIVTTGRLYDGKGPRVWSLKSLKRAMRIQEHRQGAPRGVSRRGCRERVAEALELEPRASAPRIAELAAVSAPTARKWIADIRAKAELAALPVVAKLDAFDESTDEPMEDYETGIERLRALLGM